MRDREPQVAAARHGLVQLDLVSDVSRRWRRQRSVRNRSFCEARNPDLGALGRDQRNLNVMIAVTREARAGVQAEVLLRRISRFEADRARVIDEKFAFSG